MCLVVYAAGPRPLPTVPWNEANPAFNVQEVAPDDPVRGRFDFPHVSDLGSHEGCGCGFATSQDSAGASQQSAADLSNYLREARRGGPVQVFACWSGEEGRPHGERVLLTTELAADTEYWSDIKPKASRNQVFAFNFEV